MRFASLLTVLFIGLKLTDNIDWSWFWVLSPIPILILLAIFLVGILAIFIHYKDNSNKSFMDSLDTELTKLNRKKHSK